jgi:hypothetical protein
MLCAALRAQRAARRGFASAAAQPEGGSSSGGVLVRAL